MMWIKGKGFYSDMWHIVNSKRFENISVMNRILDGKECYTILFVPNGANNDENLHYYLGRFYSQKYAENVLADIFLRLTTDERTCTIYNEGMRYV